MSTPIFDNMNVTRDANGTPTKAPANKVKWAALAGAGATILAAMLAAVTPEMLSFAGPYTAVIYAGVATAAAVVAAYVAKPA